MSGSDVASLSLRLSLLESLTYGEAESYSSSSTGKPSILIRSHNAQERFRSDIEKYKSIVHFVEEYRGNRVYLQPSLHSIDIVNEDATPSIGRDNNNANRIAASEVSSASLMSTQSMIALLLESEKDMRQLERDLRLCEHHQEKGTAGAGKLAAHLEEHERLKPQVASLMQQKTLTHGQESDIETRSIRLVERYSQQVDLISKLFIHWDELLNQTEDALTRIEHFRRQ